MNGQQNKMDKINEIDSAMDGRDEDVQVLEALKHFRESVHAWGEEEFARPRVPKRRSTFFAMRSPALNWAAAAVLGISVAAVPVVHHYQEVRVQELHEAKAVELQKQVAQKQSAYAINDEELLSNVDEDVAQEAPDAMEPLASLMTESSAKR